MKAGIFTFHYACNYGATLQCLALYRTLRSLGADADVIRYVPPDYSAHLPFWRGWGIRQGQMFHNLPKKWIAARHGPEMRNAFEAFQMRHMTFSAACASSEEVAEVVSRYDALIAGSDQVWHFAQSAPFFLEWGAPYAGKRISYAPCCGMGEQPVGRAEVVGPWLKRFDHISVRNEFSRKVIRDACGRDPEVVADPTLLQDLGDVRKPAASPPGGYIFMYCLGKQIPGGHAVMIAELRRHVGNLPVVAVIPSAHQPQPCPWADIRNWTAGPGEWLHLLSNARFVYTDSYHGALFAMKYRLPFLAYYAEKGRAPRLMDLAGRYAVESCVAGSVAEAIGKAPWEGPDYDRTHARISAHVELSLGYLRGALGLDS
jgi:hypothetical protein